MGNRIQKNNTDKERIDTHRCLSCGTSKDLGTRKYCSVDCRKKLRHQLNIRTGLLKALNTHYATFYFTEVLLILDVLPLDSTKIHSFVYPRTPHKKPVEDYGDLCNLLGDAWWGEMRRTNRGYLASKHVLNQSVRKYGESASIHPQVVKIPAIKGGSSPLLFLKLERQDLQTKGFEKVIKSAYRRQARRAHPDVGGDEKAFRRIHQAYTALMAWADEPSFLKRNGFPDKWFYDGTKNRWVQPTPS